MIPDCEVSLLWAKKYENDLSLTGVDFEGSV